jgi:hypothetical protein
MTTQVEAVYENGVFRPLQPVHLEEHQTVTVTIPAAPIDVTVFTLPPDRWQAFCDALDAPARVIAPLRTLLSRPGPFDEP